MSTDAFDKVQHEAVEPRPRKAWATPTIEEADASVTAGGTSPNNVETAFSHRAS